MKFVESIRSALRGTPTSPEPTSTGPTADETALSDVHVAACTLLLEIAYADGVFSESERSHLESVLVRHFALDADAGRRLIELAERERVRGAVGERFAGLHLHNTRGRVVEPDEIVTVPGSLEEELEDAYLIDGRAWPKATWKLDYDEGDE